MLSWSYCYKFGFWGVNAGTSRSNIHGLRSATDIGGNYVCIPFVCFIFLISFGEDKLILKLHVLVRLQIEKEKLFVEISRRYAGALCWEEKARDLLATRAPISEFEDILRFCFVFLLAPDCCTDVSP